MECEFHGKLEGFFFFFDMLKEGLGISIYVRIRASSL